MKSHPSGSSVSRQQGSIHATVSGSEEASHIILGITGT